MKKLPNKYFNKIQKINESLDSLIQDMEEDELDASDNSWILQTFEKLQDARTALNDSEHFALFS